MRWRNPLKEYLRLGRIDIQVYPISPSRQRLLEGHHSIHILECPVSCSNIIPSAKGGDNYCSALYTCEIGIKLLVWLRTNGCVGPLRFHQCQVLKMRASLFFQSWPPLMESSFKTLPIFSRTTSTKYTVRWSITFKS